MSESLKFQLHQRTYVFKFKLVFSLLCLSLFCLCCVLGVWQLHRYAYKKNLIVNYQQRIKAAPIDFQTVLRQGDLQFKRIKIDGQYLNQLTVFIQNRFYHDELGFEVLTPLQIVGEKTLLLVDRGWIKKSNINSLVPVTAQQKITGYLKLLDEYQFILGKNVLQPNQKPLVLQRIDTKDLSQITHRDFYPFILRLSPDATNGYVRDWTIISVTPERHLAYAVQWFALALVLLIAYFCFCYERKELTRENKNAKNK